jgi:predicted AAA+ superfamily ATPase
MGLKERTLTPSVVEDLKEKMVFIGGPRQVGKTTLSNELVAPHFRSFAYFSWDNRSDRMKIRNSEWPGEAQLLIFDEIHKYRPWKRLLKGEYDKLKSRYRFLVTGSARLDIYRRGGDSLQGRYHHYRLHPFSMREMIHPGKAAVPFQELAIGEEPHPKEMETLERFGGFPEPLLKQDDRLLRRWHSERHERLFREDIRDVELVRDLSTMQALADMLPEKVGSLFSINSIREDLEVSHKAVVRWMGILESFYYAYRIYPFSRSAFRSLKKEPKLYLWDWSEVPEEATRFENMVAGHLLKLVHYLQDHEGYSAELYFLRDTAGREVDFLLTVDGKPWFAVEAKLDNLNVNPAIRYFQDRLRIPFSYQVVKKSGVDTRVQGTRLLSADKFLMALI